MKKTLRYSTDSDSSSDENNHRRHIQSSIETKKQKKSKSRSVSQPRKSPSRETSRPKSPMGQLRSRSVSLDPINIRLNVAVADAPKPAELDRDDDLVGADSPIPLSLINTGDLD